MIFPLTRPKVLMLRRIYFFPGIRFTELLKQSRLSSQTGNKILIRLVASKVVTEKREKSGVDPEGNLAACPAFLNTSWFPFNIKQKKDLEKEEEFKKWAKRSPLLNKTCYSCIALGLCGGGCAFNSQKKYQNIYALDEFYCNYARGITKWMLHDLYKIVTRNHHGKYVPIPQIL